MGVSPLTFERIHRSAAIVITPGKRGVHHVRRILVVGACAVLRYARHKPEKYPWLTQLLARKPFKVAAVALANKMARFGTSSSHRQTPYAAAASAGTR